MVWRGVTPHNSGRSPDGTAIRRFCPHGYVKRATRRVSRYSQPISRRSFPRSREYELFGELKCYWLHERYIKERSFSRINTLEWLTPDLHLSVSLNLMKVVFTRRGRVLPDCLWQLVFHYKFCCYDKLKSSNAYTLFLSAKCSLHKNKFGQW